VAETLVGYAAVFDSPTVIAGEFREQIAPGAFADALAGSDDVLALIGHDWNRVIGRRSAGTLRLSEDSHGLRVEIDADERTPDGQTASGTVARQDLNGMSFGFFVLAEQWKDGGNQLPLRIIEKIALLEVSIVSAPAYAATEILPATGRSASVARAIAAQRRRGITPAEHNRLAASRRRAQAAMRKRGLTP
jgi:HK97 family phage prohead protease